MRLTVGRINKKIVRLSAHVARERKSAYYKTTKRNKKKKSTSMHLKSCFIIIIIIIHIKLVDFSFVFSSCSMTILCPSPSDYRWHGSLKGCFIFFLRNEIAIKTWGGQNSQESIIHRSTRAADTLHATTPSNKIRHWSTASINDYQISYIGVGSVNGLTRSGSVLFAHDVLCYLWVATPLGVVRGVWRRVSRSFVPVILYFTSLSGNIFPDGRRYDDVSVLHGLRL